MWSEKSSADRPLPDRSPFITFLRLLGRLFPGDFLKTTAYLNLVHRPRKLLRNSLNAFYRIDHIYDVIAEFRAHYAGRFSILEFGVADGYSFTKKLYATRYLKMDDRICVHGFDTFEGMPATDDQRDLAVVDDSWVAGQFKTDYARLEAYCAARYSNFVLHRGTFEETLTPSLLDRLRVELPILIWIDCDYYTSARTVFERLIPYIPSGCVIYFDEYEFNYGSRLTGEARIVHEINTGLFSDHVELVLDRALALDHNRVYRFINEKAESRYRRLQPIHDVGQLRRRTNDSPFP